MFYDAPKWPLDRNKTLRVFAAGSECAPPPTNRTLQAVFTLIDGETTSIENEEKVINLGFFLSMQIKYMTAVYSEP